MNCGLPSEKGDFQWIPVHHMTRCRALPFFHAFTGCDTVSAFVGNGRHGMCFKLLLRYSLVSVLQSAQLQTTSLASLKNLIMYVWASETNKVDEARLDLFARKQRQYNAVPPSSTALVQHVKRSVLQAGHTWGQALSRIQNLPTPSNWGWKKENDVWVPHWTSLAPIAASCQELLKCGCKKNCSGNCKCFRSGLTCTALVQKGFKPRIRACAVKKCSLSIFSSNNI